MSEKKKSFTTRIRSVFSRENSNSSITTECREEQQQQQHFHGLHLRQSVSDDAFQIKSIGRKGRNRSNSEIRTTSACQRNQNESQEMKQYRMLRSAFHVMDCLTQHLGLSELPIRIEKSPFTSCCYYEKTRLYIQIWRNTHHVQGRMVYVPITQQQQQQQQQQYDMKQLEQFITKLFFCSWCEQGEQDILFSIPIDSSPRLTALRSHHIQRPASLDTLS